MAEPVKLVPRGEAEANASVVDVLERALALARSGDLNGGVAVVAVRTDGSNYAPYSVSPDRLKLVGLLDWARHRMLIAYENS